MKNARPCLPNPDHLWPESAMSELNRRHDEHKADLEAFEQRFNAYSDRIDALIEAYGEKSQ